MASSFLEPQLQLGRDLRVMTKKISLNNKQDLIISPSTPFEIPEAPRYTAIPTSPRE